MSVVCHMHAVVLSDSGSGGHQARSQAATPLHVAEDWDGKVGGIEPNPTTTTSRDDTIERHTGLRNRDTAITHPQVSEHVHVRLFGPSAIDSHRTAPRAGRIGLSTWDALRRGR